MDFIPKSRSKWLLLGSKTSNFFMKFWLQSVLKNFLEVVGSYVRYVRGTRRQGLYNALTPVVIRPLNPFLFGKNWASWHFLQNQGQNDLPLGSKKGHFSMKFWLQTLLKFFLWVIWCSLRYLEGPPRSGLYNAPTPVVIRPRNPFLFRKKVNPPAGDLFWKPLL